MWKTTTLAYFILVLLIVPCISIGNLPPNTQTIIGNCVRKIFVRDHDSFTLYSPGFPASYTQGSACIYMVYASAGNGIDANCQINFPYSPLLGCTTEHFLISAFEDPYFQHGEHFCGNQTLQVSSRFEAITIGYISINTCNVQQTGYFRCNFMARSEPCDCGWSSDTKIVGGVVTKVNEFPFMAGLVDFQRFLLYCGSSIISKSFVITAGHCVYKVNQESIGVIIGEYDITTVADTPYTKLLLIEDIIIHEMFQTDWMNNDIALVRTKTPIEWSLAVGPICLPFLYPFANFSHETVEISGWGTISFGGSKPAILMKATTKVLPSNECITGDSVICTYALGNDSCQYDSGGPVFLTRQRIFLIGIISNGPACYGFGYNTRVTSFLEWIRNKTVGESFCIKKF